MTALWLGAAACPRSVLLSLLALTCHAKVALNRFEAVKGVPSHPWPRSGSGVQGYHYLQFSACLLCRECDSDRGQHATLKAERAAESTRPSFSLALLSYAAPAHVRAGANSNCSSHVNNISSMLGPRTVYNYFMLQHFFDKSGLATFLEISSGHSANTLAASRLTWRWAQISALLRAGCDNNVRFRVYLIEKSRSR